MSEPTLKPETIADLKQYVLAKKGMFGALHLKNVEQSCNCDICKTIREAVEELK
jgi:hypothetical protein